MHEERQELVGFIGIGIMGRRIAARLLEAGHEVLVWNRTPGACDELVDEGAEEADSVAAVVENCDVIFLCLSDADAVEEVVFGEDGIAALGQPDQLLVDLSSIDPGATRRFAQELAQACGMPWVDAPVSGGPGGAEQGTLAIMAGGHEEDVERARPLLEAFGGAITRMGPVGAGQLAKLCNQMMVCGSAMLLAEMIALAERTGIDAELLPAAFAGGLADSPVLRGLGPRMAVRQYEPVLARLGTMQKDLDTIVAVARSAEANVPLSALAAQLVRQHRAQAGNEADCTSIIELYAAE